MGYRLGVDLGTTFTAAVIHRPGTAPTAVPLGDRSATMPSVLFIGEDGTVLMGEAAERRAVTDPDRVLRRFKRRIGDETPLLVGPGGVALTAHALAARLIAMVADRAAEQEGGAPSAIAVTVPAGWGTHKKDLLTSALTREGLLGVTLVDEPTAAALAYANTGRLGAGTTVGVYDFGGGTFDAALLRAGKDGQFTPLGSPSGLPNLGGIDFDDAVLAYVLGMAGPQTPGIDPADPVHLTAMTRLRRECTDAKEALSADSTATVPVLLGGAQTSVRLTRGEFEAMIGGAVEQTCIAMEAALVSAGLTGKKLDRILLAGGSSRIPLVSQLLSTRYPGVSVERDIDAMLAVAIGGVLALDVATPSGGRHAAPRPLAQPAAVAAVITTAATPARPVLNLEAFAEEREPDPPRVVAQRRKAPTVLMAAASLILFGGFGLNQIGALQLGNALPGPSLQEAHAGTNDTESGGLEVESVEQAKTAAKDGKAGAGKSSNTAGSTAASNSDSSAPTASGRTEGSADTRSAESSGSTSSSDTSTADARSDRSEAAKPATRDHAAAERKAAKADTRKKAATGSTTSAPATQPATGDVSPGTAPAAPTAPSEAEDTSTDSGVVEFNSGNSQEPPVAP